MTEKRRIARQAVEDHRRSFASYLARVEGGHLLVDAATSLPNGTEVPLDVCFEYDEDELTPDQRRVVVLWGAAGWISYPAPGVRPDPRSRRMSFAGVRERARGRRGAGRPAASAAGRVMLSARNEEEAACGPVVQVTAGQTRDDR